MGGWNEGGLQLLFVIKEKGITQAYKNILHPITWLTVSYRTECRADKKPTKTKFDVA